MKSILVIGLGRFGMHISRQFEKLGNDVLAIDISEERVNDVLHHIPNAQIGDCTNRDVLEEIGVRNFDICIVAIGTNLGSALEITYLLKQMGAPYIIAKTSREMHGKFLLNSGADEVVYPEMQMANRIAVKHSASKLFDYIEITNEYSISELPVPKKWIGETIEHIAVRTKFHINILATKKGDDIAASIKPSHIFESDEHLLVFGKKDDIIEFTQRF